MRNPALACPKIFQRPFRLQALWFRTKRRLAYLLGLAGAWLCCFSSLTSAQVSANLWHGHRPVGCSRGGC